MNYQKREQWLPPRHSRKKERREYLFEKDMNKARAPQIKEGVNVQELLEKLSVVRDQ